MKTRLLFRDHLPVAIHIRRRDACARGYSALAGLLHLLASPPFE